MDTAPESRAPRIERVEKRDGRLVRFQLEKIRDAVAAALEAVGSPDLPFAAEVASLVELALSEEVRAKRSQTPYVPHIEEIQDLVERALMELGRPAVAKAYILYREQRKKIREAVRVHKTARTLPLRVREAEGVSLWSKGKLVGALMEEAELSREVAEELAQAVERRVFASGLRQVTTALIREVVTGELLERGCAQASLALSALGLSRHDLARLLAEDPLYPWAHPWANHWDGTARANRSEPRARVEESVASEVLKRFTLEDLVSGEAAELHRSGDLHLEDVGAPHLALAMCVDAGLLSSGGHSGTSAFAVLEGVADCARRVLRVLVLERPAEVLAPLMRSVRASSPLGLPSWLSALTAIARARGVRIDLGSSGMRYTAFSARLLETLAELEDGPYASRLYLEGHELEALLAEHPALEPIVEELLAQGRLLSTWGESEERFAGPGCHRREREPGILACGAAIAINLPRLARRAGPWREDLMQSGVAELVQAAVEVAGALNDFQRTREARGAAGVHVRRSFAIVPVGLREALLHLGEGEIDADQGARLLGLISEAAQRFARESSLACLVSPFFGERAARRFAWLDGRRAQEEGVEQRWLFHEEERAGGPPIPYTAELRLSPVPSSAAGGTEAECLRTLSAGALSFVGLPGLRESPHETPHLAAWRRFEALRRARSGEIELELFPAPGPVRSRRPSRPPTPPLRPRA